MVEAAGSEQNNSSGGIKKKNQTGEERLAVASGFGGAGKCRPCVDDRWLG